MRFLTGETLETHRRSILLFQTEDGRVPFSEWMDSLKDVAAYGMIMNRLDRVEDGNFGVHKSVGGGVTELVIDAGPGYRIYLGQDGNDFVILLIGGSKRTQSSDIETAKRYWRTYNA